MVPAPSDAGAPPARLLIPRTLPGVVRLSAGPARRRPAADPLAFADVDHWVEAGRVAERGLLDAVFLSDTPGLWGDIGTDPQGAHFLEPTLILTAIARATERIGLIGTASTSFNEPYNIARRFKSLDLISHGRAGWNAVTTFVPAVGENFGQAGVASREDRYSRAEEFVDVVRALWRSWEPDALTPRGTGWNGHVTAVGTPEQVAERLTGLVEESGADEVLVVTNIPDPGERKESYRRLADVMGMGPRDEPLR
ncbi:LLM class flavin-dependent oxidoreductase [Streptosporangium sp. CA-135522]|uniref:LLM class flavin-dependent oxidoreductase n=1 Tax=Streptosporangium sp. CA-135522 TaxID=3240072 RepID=UPI003D913922